MSIVLNTGNWSVNPLTALISLFFTIIIECGVWFVLIVILEKKKEGTVEKLSNNFIFLIIANVVSFFFGLILFLTFWGSF